MDISQLSAPQLKALLESPAPPRLLDVREPWEWQLAHIDGSHSIPMANIPERLNTLDRAHPTVVICHHGVRSLQVVAFLQHHGFDNLHNLAGGIDAWARQVDPTLATY